MLNSSFFELKIATDLILASSVDSMTTVAGAATG
jgi:hypothetical protein